jgi:hypothetical protein
VRQPPLVNNRETAQPEAMDWFAPIDDYCERLDASMWSEPLNALSNASFIIAGLLLLRQWHRGGRASTAGLVLVINVLTIGIGSFLFHTLANRWSSVADVVPIVLFIHLYVMLGLRAYLGFRWWQAILATLVFFAVTPFVARAIAPVIGSSAAYVPALLAIVGVGLAAGERTVRRTLLVTGGLFALSVYYRAVDLPLCDLHPQGTHARWHLLNGMVLYLLVSLYMRVTARPAAR